MSFFRQFDEDHLIILGLGEFVPVGTEMACQRPIRAWKVLVQCGQGMVAAVGDFETLLFLSCLRCSAAAILLASWDFAPLQTDARHLGLSIAACSHGPHKDQFNIKQRLH